MPELSERLVPVGAAGGQVAILWTSAVIDGGRPLTPVRGCMPDARVRQFWDETHLVANQVVADTCEPQPVPECCDKPSLWWDSVAVAELLSEPRFF